MSWDLISLRVSWTLIRKATDERFSPGLPSCAALPLSDMKVFVISLLLSCLSPTSWAYPAFPPPADTSGASKILRRSDGGYIRYRDYVKTVVTRNKWGVPGSRQYIANNCAFHKVTQVSDLRSSDPIIRDSFKTSIARMICLLADASSRPKFCIRSVRHIDPRATDG